MEFLISVISYVKTFNVENDFFIPIFSKVPESEFESKF